MRKFDILAFSIKIMIFLNLAISLGDENIYKAKVLCMIFALAYSLEVILRVKFKIYD